jgi:hypothetical protein
MAWQRTPDQQPSRHAEWPESHKVIDIDFADVPLDEVRKMTCGDVSKLFSIPGAE